ncbi:MAG: flagellar filament capping protein FliD [Candidatus Hydrogenedentes bacterium]|nr:flagellar filament capping protein FliD [Candidatus Hydrogenedentota bacterium]
MSGSFSISGLISGLDSATLIQQLMSLERQPITRLETRLTTLNQQREAIRELRTTLTTLRNTVQDFRFNTVFNQYAAASSEEDVLTAEISGSSPVSGSYSVEVIQLASATTANSSAALGSAINPNATLENSGIATAIEEGSFAINGVEFTVDPTTDTLNSILADINASAAGVTATYDSLTDRITIANSTAGDTSVINFSWTGDADDESNFLRVVRLTGATQSTNSNGSTEVTSTGNLGAVSATDALNLVNFANGAVTSGSFKINGITINVDATTDSISDILGRINDSDAGVTASYDSATDTIRVVSDTLGSRTVNFTSGTSNFLDIVNLTTATQTAGRDSQFKINGGAVQTRNSNEVADAIGGVTLNFLSEGTSTVTVSLDDDTIVEDVQEFIEQYNASVTAIQDLVATGGVLAGDSSIRFIQDFLRSSIFSNVSGISGDYSSLAEIGFNTGDSFDSGSISALQLDEDEFREALRNSLSSVKSLFSNSGDTGIADLFFDYLDEATNTQGFLNERVRSNGIIEQQINSINDRIEQMEERLETKEARLRAQFTRLEQLSATYQAQASALSSIGASF